MMLLPTHLNMSSTYVMNYPGQLRIPLGDYIFGSNITVDIIDRYDK